MKGAVRVPLTRGVYSSVTNPIPMTPHFGARCVCALLIGVSSGPLLTPVARSTTFAWPGVCRIRRAGRQHHPSGLGRVHDPDDRPRRPGRGGARRVHAANARRPRRLHARHRHAHACGEDAGRDLRRARRARAPHPPGSSSRSPPTSPRWRQAPTSAPRIRSPAAGEQMDETMAKKAAAGRRRLRAHARRRAPSKCDARRAGGRTRAAPSPSRRRSTRRRRSSISWPRTCPICCGSSTAGRSGDSTARRSCSGRPARASCRSR